MSEQQGLAGVIREMRDWCESNAPFEVSKEEAGLWADRLQPFLEQAKALHDGWQDEDKKHADLIPTRAYTGFEKMLLRCLEKRTAQLNALIYGSEQK